VHRGLNVDSLSTRPYNLIAHFNRTTVGSRRSYSWACTVIGTAKVGSHMSAFHTVSCSPNGRPRPTVYCSASVGVTRLGNSIMWRYNLIPEYDADGWRAELFQCSRALYEGINRVRQKSTLRFCTVFFAVAWNKNAKFYQHIQSLKAHISVLSAYK